MPTILKNGTIATASKTFRADILVVDDVIAEIGTGLTQADAKVIDARGGIVIPGGIDVHTHFNLDIGIAVAQDDFYTGTVAAAFGGTTCIVDHPGFGPAGCGLDHQIKRYHDFARHNAVVDYSFHGVLQDVNDGILDQLAELSSAGIPSIKAYMTYDGKLNADQLRQVLERFSALGGLTAVHAEDDAMLAALKQKLTEQDRADVGHYPATRPAACEARSVTQALSLAADSGDAPLYIVHLSTTLGLDQITQARAAGQDNIYVETCPQYLLLDESLYRQPDGGGFKYVMAPPLRTVDDTRSLWQGLEDGKIDVVATDHCPFDFEKKKVLGAKDFTRCPGGIPGVETRIPLLYSEGVSKKRISLNRFVEVVSTAPAKIMGLYPRKGNIAPGSDADLVIIDPEQRRTVTHSRLHHNVDYTPYEGMTVHGWPVLTMVRGEVITKEDQLVGTKGYGQFINRNRTRDLQ